MNEYRVIWEIDLEAESPVEAAKLAQAIHRDPNSTASIFSVVDQSGKRFEIDAALEGE